MGTMRSSKEFLSQLATAMDLPFESGRDRHSKPCSTRRMVLFYCNCRPSFTIPGTVSAKQLLRWLMSSGHFPVTGTSASSIQRKPTGLRFEWIGCSTHSNIQISWPSYRQPEKLPKRNSVIGDSMPFPFCVMSETLLSVFSHATWHRTSLTTSLWTWTLRTNLTSLFTRRITSWNKMK